MTSVLAGTAGTQGLIGFGTAGTLVSVLGGTLSLAGGPGLLQNLAFYVPRDGTITSIAGYFSTTAAVTLLGTVTITARLYESTTPNNTFTQIATLPLTPTLSGVVSLGTISSAVGTFSIPVTAGTRLLLVFTATSSGLDIATVIAGYASGGVGIS